MKRASAPNYDLFKGIVTLVLIVILILMLLRGCMTTTPLTANENTAAPISISTSASTESVLVSEANITATSSPLPTAAEPTATPTIVAPTPTATVAAPRPTEFPTSIPDTVTPTLGQNANSGSAQVYAQGLARAALTALMSAGPLTQKPRRQQSCQMVGNALLQAIASMASRR